MINKRLFFISIILLIVVSIGAVSASDALSDNNVNYEGSGNENIIIDEGSGDGTDASSSGESTNSDDSSESDNSEGDDQTEIVQVSGDTFEDIQNAVLSSKENSVIRLNGNYQGNGNYIYINKNLTLEGEDATLDARGLSGIILSEKAIILKNIIFKNADVKEAVYIEGNATIINCTFEGNKNMAIKCRGEENSDNVIIKDSTFKSNYMVLDSTAANLNIENSTFDSNKATGWEDTVFKFSDSKKIPSKVSITNSSFISNSGESTVFYFELINSASSSVIDNCYFNKNKATDSAVIYLLNGTLNIKNSIFGNNTRVISTDVPNVYENNNKLIIKNSTFDNNSKFVLYNNVNCSMDSCTFKNNKNDLINNYDDLYIKNSKFLNNKGAIDHWGVGVLKISNSTFTNSSNDVAAVYSYNGNLKVIDCKFKCNSEAAIISCNKASITNNNHTSTYESAISLSNSLKPFSFIKYTLSNFTTSYNSGKTYMVKAVYGISKKVCSNLKFKMEVYSSGNYVKTFWATANSKGIAYFKVSGLNVGSYKAVLCYYKYKPYDFEDFTTVKSSIKIKKANTIVKAPKVTARFKKSKYFKVTVKNKASNKVVSNIKVKIKVYTGKKYKTYTVKTNKKGLAKLNTKKLKRGKHKVVISSGNKKYIISKKSTIIIK